MSNNHTLSHVITFVLLGGITMSLGYLLLTTPSGLYA